MEEGKANPWMHMLLSNDYVTDLGKLIATVHRFEVQVIVPLNHAGRQITSRVTGRRVVAPSPLPCPVNQEVPRELTPNETREIIEAFASAAVRARKAGADGIELHMAHGYLINQFLSKTPGIDSLGKTTFFDSVFWGDDVTGKIIFFEGLKKVLSGRAPFQVEKDENLELVLKCHFQRSISSCPQW